MDRVFTIYSVFFIATSLVSFFVAFLAFQRRTVIAAKQLAWLMLSVGSASFWLIFETAAPTMGEKIIWAKLEYSGGVITPVLYLIFVLRFTGRDTFLTRRNMLLLFLIPAVTFLLVLTNEKHNLIWSGFSPISGKTNLMDYYHGIWFWIGYIAYTYLLLLISSIYLIQFILHQVKTFRYQAWIIFAGGMFPWIVSVIYLTGKSPVPGLDLTPFSITLSGILAGYAILYSHLLDLVPVARETLVEIMPDGIIVLDSRNRIQDINEAAISFLGIPKKNVIGSDACAFGAKGHNLMNAAIQNNPFDLIEVREKDDLKTYSITRQSIKRQPGSYLVIIRDITNMKKTEEELIRAKERAEESDRLKSAFLANMSHEIRTPLNGILGFTDLLKTSELTHKEQDDYLEIIRKGGDRLLNIINDIIDISKIESGQMLISISKTDIREQLKTIYSFFKPEADSKGITLIFANMPEEEEIIIETDAEKLYAIHTNLIKNGIKFTQSGYVKFGYVKKKKLVEFFVEDTGTGIRSDQLEYIFERFRQGNDTLTRNFEGTGLGLSISKAYVEMLGGKIWVESEYGKGSVFHFTIPDSLNTVFKFAENEQLHTAPPVYETKELVVLIVEDDKPSEVLMSKLIGRLCKRILTAETGTGAVDICRKNPDIDLILMDIELREMDGYEATRSIRTFNKEVIIIAQTAFGLTGDDEKAIEAGCNDYIPKPIHSKMLLSMIDKYFSKSSRKLQL